MNGGPFAALNVVRVLAIVLVALALVPAGAHLFELPAKMQLSAVDYMTVQQIYRGWALFGFAVAGALIATSVHTYLVREQPVAFWLSLGAVLCIVATQVIFWSFTYPMNVATSNWTVTPQDFDAARAQWESSHAANAVASFIGLMLIAASVAVGKPGPG